MPTNFDWALTGLEKEKTSLQWEKLGVRGLKDKTKSDNLSASIILPQGRYGPAFMVFPNFKVLFEWNKSFVYVTTAAYFATLLEGGSLIGNTNADPGLNSDDMKALQKKLIALGYDVGKIDGILGAKTRVAVQSIQIELGMSADAWPTKMLLDRL